MMMAIWLWITSPLTQYMTASTVIGGGAAALAILTPAWLPIKRDYLIIIACVAFGSGFFYLWAFTAGEAHNSQAVAAHEQKATQNVGRAAVKVSECLARGGVWNTVNGMCD